MGNFSLTGFLCFRVTLFKKFNSSVRLSDERIILYYFLDVVYEK